MMVRSCNSYSCSEDEGGVSGDLDFLMENGMLKEKIMYSLELEFKGEGKGLGLGFFCKMGRLLGGLSNFGDGRGDKDGLGYFGGDILKEEVRIF